jgi:hypothetical protein
MAALVRASAVLLTMVHSASAGPFVDACGAKTSCEDCLMEGEHNFCGWCSPGPVIYASGKPGKRCADERDEPWDCPQHYMTKSCPAKYTCNTTAGTCTHAKLGDAKATNQSECAKTCHKKVPPQHHNKTTTKYTCQNQTGTCEPAHSAGGVPSSNGTDLATCNQTCHKAKKPIPLALNGLWRGVMISKGFKTGEYDFLFDSSKNTVALSGPGISNETADVTTGMTETSPPQITLAFKGGPDSGKFRKAIFMVGPAGPETNTTIIGLGPPFPDADTASAPASFAAAMAGGTNEVFFLRACLSDPGLDCAWAGAPPPSKSAIRKIKVGKAVVGLTEIEAVVTLDELAAGASGVHSRRMLQGVNADEDEVRFLPTLQSEHTQDHALPARRVAPPPPPGPAPTGDPCNVHKNCSTCNAADAGHQCGWCTAPVSYGNGTPGLLRSGDVPGAVHCAGFSAAGVAKPWECNGLYVRGPCYDHICEVFPNYTVNCRHTAPGEVGTMSEKQCPLKCKPPTKVYACNHTVGKCQVVAPGHAGGEAQSICAKNCTKPPPPPPPPPPGFVCNNATLTCEMVNGSNCSTAHNAPANAPKCQTAPACHKVCQPVYQCQVTGNGTNYTCVEVPLGTPGAQNHSACASTCVEPPKHNCTPPVLQGKYRGISIGGSGMPHAEWDLRLGHCDAELRNANGTVWKASVYTGGAAPLSFRLETGGELHGLYTFENGLDLETVRFTLALGKLNGNAPKDWMTAMAPGSNMTVYGLVKCASDKPGKPVPGGIYCDPKSTPPEMCPPLNPGDKPTPCHCANPDGPGGTCLCPGHYPPPPPPPPGAGSCNFTSVFEDDALVTRATGHVQH